MRTVTRAICAVALALVATPARGADPIVVCAHVPMTGASPVPRSGYRYGQFYFDHVNAAQGGVRGRPVRFIAYDDGSYPAGARAAVERCRTEGPVMIVGVGGRDATVSVAKMTTRYGIPYLRAAGSEATDGVAEHTWLIGPSDEDQMRGLVALIAGDAALFGRVAGIVRVSSPYYEAGRDAFARALERRGIPLAVDRVVQKDERQFSELFLELVTKEVTVLNLFVPPSMFATLLRQKPQTYDPTFVSIGPEAGSDANARSTIGSRILVLHEPNPMYDPADPSLPWYEEMQRFGEIFERSGAGALPDDVDWASYLRATRIHRILLALEGDYSPRNVARALDAYAESRDEAFPSCAIDFTGEPRIGSHAWNVFRGDAGRWRQSAFCATAEDTDITPPAIACEPAAVATRLRCGVTDRGSGVGIVVISFRSAPVTPQDERLDGGCDRRVMIDRPLPPGAHVATVRALSCSGAWSSDDAIVVA